MSIKVIDTIEPKNAGDFPIVGDQHVKGGAHVVADHATRDALTTAFRKAGMVVITQNDGLAWQLGADLTTWNGAGGDLSTRTSFASPTVVAVQGTPVARRAAEPDGYVLALATEAPTFSTAEDLFYDSATNLVWVSDFSTPVVRAFDATTMAATVTAVVAPFLFDVRRMIGDSSYVYLCSPQGATGRTVVILDKFTGSVVGSIKMPFGSKGRDLALDGLGFLWVMDKGKGVRKYDIASAVAAFPFPYATEAANNLVEAVNGHTICYGGGFLWVGDSFPAATPMHKIDGTGTWIATFDSGPTFNFFQHYGQVFAKGMVWAASQGSSLRRYDPATFPAPGCMVQVDAAVAPGTIQTIQPSYDPYTDTIITGNDLSDQITRWSAETTGTFSYLELFPLTTGSPTRAVTAVTTTRRIWSSSLSLVEMWTDVVGASTFIGSSVTRLAYTAAGGGVTILEEGVDIGGNPHSTLNFVGDGVTATDAGGGQTDITIPGSSIIEVANFAALVGISDAGLPNGALAWVNTFKDWFKLDHTSTRAADTTTTSLTLSGTGRWLRTSTPHVFWQEQPAWFIDSGVGDDENAGTTGGAALQTHAELVRRVGHGYVPTVDITISVMSTTVDAIFAPFKPLNTFVYYVGTQTSLGSTTTTSYTGRDPSLNQPALLNTTDLTFFGTYPNALFVFAAPPYANYAFWTVATTANPGERVCSDITRLSAGSTVTQATLTMQFPAGFDTLGATRTINAMSLTTVPQLVLPVTDADSASQLFVGFTKQPYVFQDFEFTQSLPEPVTVQHRATFFQCLFPYLTTVDSNGQMTIDGFSQIDALTKLANCNCNQFRVDLVAATQIIAGKYTGIEAFGKLYLTAVFLGTGSPPLYVHPGAEVYSLDCWSWDWSSAMIWVHAKAACYIETIWGSSTIFGSFALRIESQGLAQAEVGAGLYTASNGTAYDFVLGLNSGGGFRITCRAFDDSVGTYTSLRALTFALWTTTVAGGGFGRNVVDPVTGAAFTYGRGAR